MNGTFRLLASCLLLVVFPGIDGTSSRQRVYYIGIVEDNWDYAPSGKNLLNGKDIADDQHATKYLQKRSDRIGRVYKKAMFRQYTDSTYSQRIPGPAWLGFLGPILRAEVGDVIIVHLKNFASRNYSMHPHGVFYEKDSEGALYPDGTLKVKKMDDSVPPEGVYTYRWEVKPEFAPTADDANCLTWVYHSHVDAPKDIASGLIGSLLTCKKGILKEVADSAQSSAKTQSARNDVDQDIFLMFNVVDENLSWYKEDNIQSCLNPDSVDQDNGEFQESNLMHAINGFVFGNLPKIELCQGQAVAWHLFGMGNEADVHSAYFHGNTLLDRGHRTDVLSLFPATFATANMVPKAIGKWRLSCQVNDHLQAGMQAFYEVKSCNGHSNTMQRSGVTRIYYIAVEKVLWDYAPSEKDLINHIPLTDADSASEKFFFRNDSRIGGQYYKVIYKGYTDESFTTEIPQTRDFEHLGLLGPVIRADEGDIINVTLMNKADKFFGIQPHGLFFESADSVGPGETATFIWHVLEGPSPTDPSCIPYLYFSGADPVADTNSGLIGPLLVCRKGSSSFRPGDKRPEGIDKIFFLLFSVMDENESRYSEENMAQFAPNETDPENEDFMESNMMHAMNGRMYGNLKGLEMCAGDKVMWYTFGLGTEVDIHGVYFEGNTFKKQSTTRDTLNLFPHVATAVFMQPSVAGVYEVNCKVTDHYSAGMRQEYRVNNCPQNNFKYTHTAPTKIVQYFISAEEIVWDYSPQRDWELELYHTTEEDSPGNKYLEKGKYRMGSRYKKVVYREYTDDTFSVQKEQQPGQQHLGILGPIIKAEVGEQIVITFKNNASKPFSITAHGVKASGAHSAAEPGRIIELTWDIPESSAPGISDPNCISYAYYSNVNFVKDLYSGLLGPLVICRPGVLQGEGSDRNRTDVNKEFALLFMVYDENESWYLEDNIREYLNIEPDDENLYEDFKESNMMHGINGRLYANLKGLEMTKGDKIDWYLLGMGNEVDMHTVHFHAETFTYKTDSTHRADVFDLFPGTFQTVEMVAGTPGTWLLHCHVTDHIHSGMETTFTIKAEARGSRSSVEMLSLPLLIAFISAVHW